jgi:hypothetical protein
MGAAASTLSKEGVKTTVNGQTPKLCSTWDESNDSTCLTLDAGSFAKHEVVRWKAVTTIQDRVNILGCYWAHFSIERK